jgi:glycosyltransferase involved in cell wall biosynthesis
MMSTSARVDVCVPTRGAAPYLEQTLDSVLAQTFEDWSMLISENGPEGGELEDRIRRYLSDPRIHYSATGGDLGAAQNHTRLIQAGSAPYVGIIHDDDRWHPEFLARRFEFLEAHAECGFVFSGNLEIDEQGREVRRSRLVLAEGAHESAEVAELLMQRNVIGIPTVLVRRSAYEAVGPAFDDETLAFDYEMWLRLTLRFRVGYLAVRDADYRVHSQQVTMTSRRRGEQNVRLLEQIEALLDGAPTVDVDRKPLRRRLAGAHLSAALDSLQDADKPSARRHLGHALRIHPSVAVDPRTPAALLGLALGARGRRALDRARYLVLRKGLRVHIRR